jgi:hypothetical protein
MLSWNRQLMPPGMTLTKRAKVATLRMQSPCATHSSCCCRGFGPQCDDGSSNCSKGRVQGAQWLARGQRTERLGRCVRPQR